MDTKEKHGGTQDIKICDKEDVVGSYHDNRSPESNLKDRHKINHDTTEYDRCHHERETKAPGSPCWSDTNMSSSDEYTRESALVEGDCMILTREIITSGGDDPGVGDNFSDDSHKTQVTHPPLFNHGG